MPSILRVSKHKVSKRLQRSVASFHCQSNLCLDTFLYCLDNARLARYQLPDPLTLRLTLLFSVLNLFKDFFKNCGDTILLPLEVVRKVVKPKSKPALSLVFANDFGVSTLSQEKHIQ